MFIHLIDRNSVIHLLYNRVQNNIYTCCGEIYNKRSIINYISLGDTDYNVCIKCIKEASYYVKAYVNDPLKKFRVNKYISFLESIEFYQIYNKYRRCLFFRKPKQSRYILR